jgi:predicted Zn finger-like uncharacterized protein
MFTVCPKCALTLVVTAQDLRVAQGYVRCGRCSNVFNAIVGLTDDRGALANPGAGQPNGPNGPNGSNGAGSSPGTATTSIIRKAPSISDDPPGDGSPGDASPGEDAPAQDPLADTGETEAVYAEPDAADVKFQAEFVEPPPAPSTPTRGPVKFVAPPPGPAPRSLQEPPQRAPDPQKRYSDTEGIETYPENELEFNPDLTDVTKVFVEAAPVTFRTNAATGQFEKILLGNDDELVRPAAQSTSSAPLASPTPPATPRPATQQPQTAKAPPTPPSPPPKAAVPPARPTREAPAREAPVREAQPPREDEEDQLDEDLRLLAAKIDGTANRPAPNFQAANDEAIASESGAPATGSFTRTTRFIDDGDEDETVIGDIYAQAKPRLAARPRDAGREGGWRVTGLSDGSASADTMALSNDAEIAVGAVESINPEAAPRSRYFGWWVAGAAALSVVLAAQAVHYNRHDLATNAFLNRPLTKLYGALGISLVPNWDLTKYDVRQLGASTSEASQGTLTVRASLKNTADQPLPLPLLRIVMQDRYGNRVATRDVPPTGYVPGAVPAEAHLGVGQRIDAEMTFKDPGQDAVGFEIDACLPNASGRISCANDAAIVAR